MNKVSHLIYRTSDIVFPKIACGWQPLQQLFDFHSDVNDLIATFTAYFREERLTTYLRFFF